MPTTPRPHRPHRRTAVAAVSAILVALLATGGSAAAQAPVVLPFDGDDAVVAVTPTAVRAPDGTAEVDITVGTAVLDDVVVRPRLALPEVAADGSVAVGPDAPGGTVDRGSRLRPGERLRVTAHGIEVPTLVVVDVTAPDGTPAATAPAALLLPGPVGQPPSLVVRTAGDEVEAVVTSMTALVVSIEVRGSTATVFPERLVLPDAPLTLRAPAPRWPLPAEAMLTDEVGRTVTASSGTTALVLVAIGLLAAAVVALAVVRRRHRAAHDRTDDVSA